MPAFLNSNLLPGTSPAGTPAGTTATRSTPSTSSLPDAAGRARLAPHPLRRRLQAGHGARLGRCCRWPPGPAVGCSGCAAPCRRPWPRPPCRSSSTTRSRSTAGTCSRRWPGSTPTRFSVSLAVLFLGLFARGHAHRAAPGAGPPWPWPLCIVVAHRAGHVRRGRGGGADRHRAAARPAGGSTTTGSGRRRAGPGRGAPRRCRPRGRRLWWAVTTVALGVLLSGWWLVPSGSTRPTPRRWATRTSPPTSPAASPGPTCGPGPGRGGRAGGRGPAQPVRPVARRPGRPLRPGLVFDPRASSTTSGFLPLWFLCVYSGGLAVRRGGGGGGPLVPPRPPGPLGGGRCATPRRAAARAGPATARWAPGAVAGPGRWPWPAPCVVVVPPFIRSAGRRRCRRRHPPRAPTRSGGWADWNYSGLRGEGRLPRVPGGHDHHDTGGPPVRLRPGHVGVQRQPEPLRHPRGPDAAALLDRRMHRLDGGAAVRVVDHHPVPLLQPGRAVGQPVRTPWSACPTAPSTCPSGVQHLQLLGVRYFMARARPSSRPAAADPDARLIAHTGPWNRLRRRGARTPPGTSTWSHDSAVVTPLTHEPAVLTGVGPAQASWLGRRAPARPVDGPSVAWYDDPARWGVELAAGGPAGWPRVTAPSGAPAGGRGAPDHGQPTSDRAGRHRSASTSSRVGTPGAGQGLLLPQLARQRRRGPLAGRPPT